MAKKWLWIGRVLTWLPCLFLLTGGVNMMFIRSADLRTGFAKFGYPENVIPWLGAAVFIGALLCLIPRTAVLGAIVMTGYLGGAIATHVRMNDPTFWSPLLVGIVLWLGLYLQDERVRSLLPVRRAAETT